MTNGGAVRVAKIFSQRMTKCDAGHEKWTTGQAGVELHCRTRMGHKRERENLRWAATVFLNFGVGRGPPGPPLGSAHGDMSPNWNKSHVVWNRTDLSVAMSARFQSDWEGYDMAAGDLREYDIMGHKNIGIGDYTSGALL
jgi:hypothetical protein